MMLLVLSLLFAPVCASTAGIAVWGLHRNESLDDGELLKQFLFLLAFCALALWGVSRTDTVRLRIDPFFRIQTELDANPVYSTVKRLNPDLAKPLEQSLVAAMVDGATLDDALAQVRPMLASAVNERSGFADQSTRILWAHVVADSLRELRAQDPSLCYRMLSAQKLDSAMLTHAYSAANAAAFQQAVVRVHESADRGMRHERPPGDKPVEFNAAALEFRVVQNEIEHQYGHAVAVQIAAKRFPNPPESSAQLMCSARIFQLDAMAKRPQAMASMLLDSALR